MTYDIHDTITDEKTGKTFDVGMAVAMLPNTANEIRALHNRLWNEYRANDKRFLAHEIDSDEWVYTSSKLTGRIDMVSTIAGMLCIQL